MKSLPITLFLSLLCTANSGLSAAHVDMRPEDIGTQDTGLRKPTREKPTQSPSLLDRWRSFSLRDLLTGRGKKKPAASQAPALPKFPGDIDFDGRTEANRIVDLNTIKKIADAMKKHLDRTDVSTEKLQSTDVQNAVRRMISTSLVIR